MDVVYNKNMLNLLRFKNDGKRAIAKITIEGRVRIVTRKAGTQEIIRTTPWEKNLIMLGTNTGKSIILNQLNGDTSVPLWLSYADIGTAQGTPAITDTVLGSPVARAAWATGSVSTNVLQLQYFFADAALANGTYYEFGTYANGSATLSSGNIFNHILFGAGYTKATGEDTTVEVDLTIT